MRASSFFNPRVAATTGATATTRAALWTARRNYMDAAHYRAEVPEHVRAAYEGATAALGPAATQVQGRGECHFVASAMRDAVLARMRINGKVFAKTRVATWQRWGDANERLIDQGFPAVVRGNNVATDQSEWRNGGTGHAVTVLSRTNSGSGFLVHEPDTTHAGPGPLPASPGANLRVMTSEQLHNVTQVAESPGSLDTNYMPAVEQRRPGWMSSLRSFMGFGE